MRHQDSAAGTQPDRTTMVAMNETVLHKLRDVSVNLGKA